MAHQFNNDACPNYRRPVFSRRHALKVGGAGLLGLNMPTLLRAAEGAHRPGAIKPRAKRVIFLFQWGGPTHIDLFDMKPDAPAEYRGPHTAGPTSVPGLHINDKCPRLAKIMDRFTLIRTMTHTMNNHNSAGYYALTGHSPPTDDQRLKDSIDLYPAYGSTVDRLAPGNGELPTFVSYPWTIADGSATPGQHASFLGKRHDPFFFKNDPNDPNFKLPELTLPRGLSIDRLRHRRGLQRLIDQQARLLDHSAEARGIDAHYEKAIAMLNSKKVRDAFDLSGEPDDLRDAYGRHTYGQSCLLARRLVEAGVKFVTVYFDRSIGGRKTDSGGWDTHGFDNTRMFPIIEKRHLPITEQTLPTLIEDMASRGLLEDTLVLWMGEFGRTPKINKNKSRDHWPQCYNALLAGAGVKHGYVYGESDKHAAYPARDPVRPDDLAATLYHLLGIDPATEVYDTQNRPLPIAAGEPVFDVMA